MQFGGVHFKTGEHGNLYTINVSYIEKNGEENKVYQTEAMFIDFDKLYNLPLISINTDDSIDPTYDEIVKPDDALWGRSIFNNEYVSGYFKMSGENLKTVTSETEIKVRGNTSTVGQDKNSYKIKLDDKCNLLQDGNFYKEWVLLNNADDLKIYLGNYISSICGLEWQLPMQFVNLILNGDWKGTYCLMPAVGYESAGELVSETGYIFENDAYWWKDGEIYFKTDHQIYQMGYTFKYPHFSTNDDARIILLKNYMQEFENLIITGNSQYKEYIDEEQFAKWILARDIMGGSDGGGSNIYLYKYDYDIDSKTSSKIKMGPLWDWDGAFRLGETWSDSRSGNVSYFPYLFEQESFKQIYLDNWERVSSILVDSVMDSLSRLEDIYGMALDESWELNSTRWHLDEHYSFELLKNEAIDWFENRVIWMDYYVDKTWEISEVINTSEYIYVDAGINSSVNIVGYNNGMVNIKGWACSTDIKQDVEHLLIGYDVNGKVYISDEYTSYEQVKNNYKLSSDKVWFDITYGYEDEDIGKICIIDINNMIIYEGVE